MTARSCDEARELVAHLRAKGVTLYISDVDRLDARWTCPPESLPALRAAWPDLVRLSVDVRAVLFAEVADVAALVARAGLPSDVRLTYRPDGQRQHGVSPRKLPPPDKPKVGECIRCGRRLTGPREAVTCSECQGAGQHQDKDAA